MCRARARDGTGALVIGEPRGDATLGENGDQPSGQDRREAGRPDDGLLAPQVGPAWQDVDRNHCDTRDDILRRDLVPFTLKPGSKCVVVSGDLHDPYTGKIIHFVRGAASTVVQIDHVVALAAAWRTGAAEWRPHRRLVYANDPAVLLAVNGPANEAKSDSDASEWVAPQYSCRYVAQQVAIKKKYTLWITTAEHDRMAQILAGCAAP